MKKENGELKKEELKKKPLKNNELSFDDLEDVAGGALGNVKFEKPKAITKHIEDNI